MSGPKGDRGRDAFDDFFGDPTPSGRMGPAEEGHDPEIDLDDEPTRDLDVGAAVAEPQTEPQPVEPAVEPAPVPSGAVPEDWWAPEPESAAAAPSPTWHAAPVPQPQPAGPAPRRGVSPFALVAMLIGGVLLGGLVVGGGIMAFTGGDDEEPVANQTTVTETSSETSSSTEEPSSSSTSSTSSSSSSPTRSGELPAGVTNCAGAKAGTSVGSGTEVTTCDFAVAVRDAYLAERPTGNVQLEVRSPVTEESYTMSCSGDSVTRCTGGNNAVVVLY